MLKRKVIDCVILNDEVHFLELRIKYLNRIVDEFIIFESSVTFSGKAKPLFGKNLRDHLERISEAKISFWESSLVDMTPTKFSQRWPVEIETRNQFLELLKSERPNDRIIFGDIDEIPSIEQVKTIRELLKSNDLSVYGINMPNYYRYANWFVQGVGERMNAPKTFVGANAPSIEVVRSLDHFDDIPGFGAHLSYLGMSSTQVTKKFGDFSHSEFSGHDKIEAYIHRTQDYFAIDHIGRYFFEGNGLLKVIKFEALSDPAVFFVSSNSSLFKDTKLPKRYRRLAASATVTFLRQFMMRDKSRFQNSFISSRYFPLFAPLFFLYFKVKGFCKVIADSLN